MAGGAYTALSGLRARIEQLDRIAADIANVGTAGYKSERTTTVAAHRQDFGRALETAIDVAAGPGRVDFRSGLLTPTGRDLDFAIEGNGFFEVQTPAGVRYTRNGQFELKSDGTLVTRDGMPVLGVERQGRTDRTLRAPAGGPVAVDAQGNVQADGVTIGRLSLVEFADPTRLVREDAGRFRASAGASPRPADESSVRGGAIEQSNVSLVERIAHMTEVSRSFQALQRGLSVMLNDIEGRAINEFGKR
jgi:flagellar basal-body rod protein FlgF